MQDNSQVVLVLGDFSHEGLSAKIEAMGFTVANRNLRSGTKNWHRIIESICAWLKEGRLPLIFVYIPTPTLLLLAEEQYDSLRTALLLAMEKTRCMWFVYEDNLKGVLEPLPWEVAGTPDEELESSDLPWATDYGDAQIGLSRDEWISLNAAKIEKAHHILAEVAERNIEVIPFRKRSDVTIRMFAALEDAEAGVFLRLYVPHGRYQSEQFEEFVALFSRYLREVEATECSIDVRRTRYGVTYVFKGRGDIVTPQEMQSAATRFDQFLALTESNPAAAERLLKGNGPTRADAPYIVAKYARAYRRLHLEMRHEFERRSLSINQEFEAELLDLHEPLVLPRPHEGQPSALFSVIGNSAPVTINLPGAAVAQGAASAISSMLSGGVQYRDEDRAIFRMLEELNDSIEALQLRSELDRLKDEGTPPEEKRTAVQKLKAFIYKSGKYLGQKADYIGTEVLIRYLESLIGPPTKL